MSLVFNGTYTEVHHQYFRMVDLLTCHFEKGLRTLNPCAAPHVPNRVEEFNTSCMPLWINKGKVFGKFKPAEKDKKQHTNKYSVLDDEDINQCTNETGVVHGIAENIVIKEENDTLKKQLQEITDQYEIEKMTYDVNIVKDGKIETLEEKYDVELVTNDTLMALLKSLNDDHVKSQQESDKIIKSLKYDIVMKKNKLKDELDTVRGLNNQYKKQMKQSAKEKKENEIKCKEMKSKMTEIEAQMELFQDTLNHNEELERMSDKYRSRLKEYEKKIKEKEKDIGRLEKDKKHEELQCKELKCKCDRLEQGYNLRKFIEPVLAMQTPEERRETQQKMKIPNRQRSKFK